MLNRKRGRKEIDVSQDRRSFIRRFGVTLGSLIASRSFPGCGSKKDGASEATSQAKKQSEPSPISRTAEWEQLRQCWLSMETLSEDINKIAEPHVDELRTQNAIEGWLAARDAVPKRRIASHQASLNALVATGQLDEAVAKHMQVAFEEAVDHIVRSMFTCYFATPLEYEARRDLLQQANVLLKISGDLDPATVAKAQAAIAKDLAFFEIFKTGSISNGSPRSKYEGGTLKASPKALEAAHLLAQLFLETPD